MIIKKMITNILSLILLGVAAYPNYALAIDSGFGQTIQIYTNFKSIIGRPSWLLIIRDIDHNQNIPYLYEFNKGNNFWLAFTYGRNYLISVSNMKFDPYTRKINNFCNLESNGAIIRGESLYITINGDLTANTNTYTCSVMRYTDSDFSIATYNEPT